MLTVCETSFVEVSIRTIVPRAGFTAQTEPAPNASDSTPVATGTVRCLTGGPGSTRQTTPSPGSLAHTAPAPTARSLGSPGTLIVAVTLFEAGSTRTSSAGSVLGCSPH